MSTTIPVTLLFADGVSQRLAVPCGGRLMDAAREAGLNLLTDCSNGQCGTCTAQLVSGAVEMEDYDSAVLPDTDRAGGAVLPCVCKVNTPCAIEFPYDSTEALSEEPALFWMNATWLPLGMTPLSAKGLPPPGLMPERAGSPEAQPVIGALPDT